MSELRQETEKLKDEAKGGVKDAIILVFRELKVFLVTLGLHKQIVNLLLLFCGCVFGGKVRTRVRGSFGGDGLLDPRDALLGPGRLLRVLEYTDRESVNTSFVFCFSKQRIC